MLPIGTILGKLAIFEIYEYLDGPRLFAARNNVGTMFLVYWFDEIEDATGWLYLPISEARLNQLRRREITFGAAFRQPETIYYLVYTGIPPVEDTAHLVNTSEIDPEFFPPDGYYVEYVDVVNSETDGWLFETALRAKNLSAEAISQYIGRFRELAEDIMNHGDKTKLRLYPQSAVVGSIKIKFRADDDGEGIRSLRTIQLLVQSTNSQQLEVYLREHDVDPSTLKEFLAVLLRNNTDVTITPKLASEGDAFKLELQQIKQCIQLLEQVGYVVVDSKKVPQANDIDKVLDVVEMLDRGIPLIPENIDGLTTSRQVDYYVTAAYALGLATEDKRLTAAGKYVNSLTDRERQYEVLADRFESTDFGWAWMKWAGVHYMTELEPKSAADFLIASAPTLSEVTARRRANTLQQWLEKLQPYHRKFRSESD